ncbi:MAG: hypothetical protein GY853_16225 [PVC group bacterium]|nr:hypothetical protein [PVC group bacterium]
MIKDINYSEHFDDLYFNIKGYECEIDKDGDFNIEVECCCDNAVDIFFNINDLKEIIKLYENRKDYVNNETINT